MSLRSNKDLSNCRISTGKYLDSNMQPAYDYYVDVDLEKIISKQDKETLAALIFKLLGFNNEFQKKAKALELTEMLEKQKEIEWH